MILQWKNLEFEGEGKEANEAGVKTMFDRIAERWKREADRIREYEIIEEGPEESFIPSYIYEYEYRQALELKQKLMQRYQGKSLEQIVSGKPVHNDYGSCYCIRGEHTMGFQKPGLEKSRQVILSNLKLIYGIGDIRERELKQQGYNNIEELTRHPFWGQEAKQFLNILESRDTKALLGVLWHWLPKSHPSVLYLAGLHDYKDFVIFDIETMGLLERPIILIGVARLENGRISTHQYLLRDIGEEPSALWEFTAHLEGNSALVTFNGRSFDLPYIEARLSFYGLDVPASLPHFDMLHFARRAWRQNLPDCRLTTIERHLLGIQREDDLPSALVPDFYETYLRTGNVGPIVAITQHNQQDLLTLTSMFSKLYEVWEDGK